MFPREEKYGIVTQINRAALSIPANITEGSSRVGLKNQSNFYSIAYSSLMELISHLIIANVLDFITSEKLNDLKSTIYEIANKLNALYKSNRPKQLNK